MTEQHPITPPPELLHQWATEYWGNPGESIGEGEKYIATQAARWGADQELEACVDWMRSHFHGVPQWADQLRAARRPKPLTLKEQAFNALDTYIYGNPDHNDKEQTYNTIRRALEQLDD